MDEMKLPGPSFQDMMNSVAPPEQMNQMQKFYTQDTPGIKQVAAKYQNDSQMTEIENKILNGEYSFKQNQDVNVIDPSGKPGKVYGSEIREALASGYRLETPKETAIRGYLDENDNLAGSAKVALKQFGNQLAMGIPEVVEEHVKDPFEVEKDRALKDQHEVANILGGVAGFGSSIMLGGPVFKGAALAGEAAERIIAKQLADAGIKQGSKSLAKDLIAKSAGAAAKMGVEGVVLEAPKAVTEASLGDTRAAAESVIIAGGLGLGLGVLSGPAGMAFKKLHKIANEKLALEKGAEAAEGVAQKMDSIPDALAGHDGSLVDAAVKTGVDKGVIEKIQAEQGILKENVNKIKESADILGVPLTEGMLSKSQVVKDADSALSQNTSTLVGAERASLYDKIFGKIDNTVKSVLGIDKPEMTSYSVGNYLKDSIGAEAEKVVKANSDFFNAIGEHYENIPINKKGMNSVINNIKKMEITEISGLSGARNSIIKDLEKGFKSIADLKNYRTELMKSVSFSESPAKKKFINEIQEKLLNQEESAIDAFAMSRMKGNVGEKTLQDLDVLGQLFQQRKAANSAWREMMENFTETGDQLGLGRIKSANDFLNEIKDIAPEQIAKKFAPKNDVNSLKRLADKYPEQFGRVMELEKYKLLEKSLKDDRIQPGTFFKELNKLTPEYRSKLFKEQENVLLDAAQTIHEAIPPNINASGTSKAIGWMHGHDSIGKSLMTNLSAEIDAMKLRNAMPVDGIYTTANFMGQVRKKLDEIPGLIDRAFNKAEKWGEAIASGKTAYGITQAISEPSQTNEDLNKKKKFEDLKKSAVDYVTNPQSIMDMVAKNIEPLSKTGAPNVANEAIMQISKQLKYINDIAPKAIRASNNFHKVDYVAPAAEVAKFNRKMEILTNPFSIFDRIKDGTLNKDHIESMTANYPVLMQAIKGRVMNHVMDNQMDMNFQQRLKMSLLMGYDVDGSTTPESLVSYQNAFANMPAIDENGDELMQSGLMKMNPAESAATPSQKMMMES